MVAPVLTELLIYIYVIIVSLLHSHLTARKRYRSAALGIRDEQGERLVDTIAPLSDIVAVETATCLISRISLNEFALSTHRLLAILPCVIEVGYIHHHSYQCSGSRHTRSLEEMVHLVLAQ